MNKLTTDKKVKVHCPYDKCLYRAGSERHFRSSRELNQHIIKVHAEKKYLCEKCCKGFGSEWQQRYHERTCGIEWKCSCGHKYNRRETLLTHHRRTQHPLANDVAKPRRVRSSAKKEAPPITSRIIVLPVNQTVIYNGFSNIPQVDFTPLCAVNNIFSHNRLILPKVSPIVPSSTGPSSPVKLPTTESSEVKKCNIKTFASVETQTIMTETTETQTDDLIHLQNSEKQRHESHAKTQTMVATQTQTARFPLSSKASQCSPRTPNSFRNRRRSYRRTSIETQTVESIVGRIKSSLHSKSRNSTKTMKKNSAAQSVWSCLNKLLTSTLSRSSSGTQTSLRGKVHHTTCASQTLAQEGSGLSSEQTAHEMLGLLATVCQHLKDNSSVRENSLGSLHTEAEDCSPDLRVKVESQDVLTGLLQVENIKNVLTESFSLEETEPIDTASSNMRPTGTLLTNIETQTSTINCPDYFSSNMETQTTEDPLLADMELSHIQTQTPWDFLDFCDHLNPNQLSADIQTDITGENLADIFEDALWTPHSGTSFIDVTDMETQTQSQMSNMELINSYTQTLDNSLQLDLPVLK